MSPLPIGVSAARWRSGEGRNFFEILLREWAAAPEEEGCGDSQERPGAGFWNGHVEGEGSSGLGKLKGIQAIGERPCAVIVGQRARVGSGERDGIERS